MRGLLLGILLIVLVGIGGLVYRNVVSRPLPATGACSLDARVCPDGTAEGRVAPACDFAPCPAPNVTLSALGIVYDLPAGYASTTPSDSASVAAYALENPNISTTASTTQSDELVIQDYPIPSGETAAGVMHATAIGDASGLPASPSSFSAVRLGSTTYTTVVLGRFEGVVHVAYYLPRAGDVLRFESIDRAVAGWTDPNLDLLTLPANAALRGMLATLQTN